MSDFLISIANDFSRFPAGRYRTDGPYSGQHFRDDLLQPALKKYDRVIVDLDGTMGFGSSFLEEAFGGLRREYLYSVEDLERKLKLEGALETYKNRVWQYIKSAV